MNEHACIVSLFQVGVSPFYVYHKVFGRIFVANQTISMYRAYHPDISDPMILQDLFLEPIENKNTLCPCLLKG